MYASCLFMIVSYFTFVSSPPPPASQFSHHLRQGFQLHLLWIQDTGTLLSTQNWRKRWVVCLHKGVIQWYKLFHLTVAERPQHMLMRVAVGIHKDDIDAAIEVNPSYQILSIGIPSYKLWIYAYLLNYKQLSFNIMSREFPRIDTYLFHTPTSVHLLIHSSQLHPLLWNGSFYLYSCQHFYTCLYYY